MRPAGGSTPPAVFQTFRWLMVSCELALAGPTGGHGRPHMVGLGTAVPVPIRGNQALSCARPGTRLGWQLGANERVEHIA